MSGQEIHDNFITLAEELDTRLNDWLDELVVKWAWLLKKFYGYDKYDVHIYDGYNDDYTDDWVAEYDALGYNGYGMLEV